VLATWRRLNQVLLDWITLPLHLHLLIHDLILERQQHLLIGIGIQAGLVTFAEDFI